MKRRTTVIIITIMIMIVFVGAGSVAFVTSNPIIDLNSLVVDSPGVNMGDVSIYDTDPNNDSDNPQISGDPTSQQAKYEYTVRVRGKNIYFDNRLLLSVDALIKAMDDANVGSTSVVHLVEDYADSVVYKNVAALIEDRCILIIDSWE